MDKIDRLGWTAGTCLTAFGVNFGVRTNDARVLDLMKNYLPPTSRFVKCREVVEHIFSLMIHGACESSNEKLHAAQSSIEPKTRNGVRRFNFVYNGFTQVVRTLDAAEAFDRFEAALQQRIAEYSPTHVFVHSGVVGWRGGAILIPGMSFSGKTTLTAELVKRGAIYYSDEFAVLDGAGRVHPFAKPLAMREGATAHQTKRAAEFFGGRAGKKPLPVRLIVVSEYKAGATWRPQSLSAGHGALALLANTVSARRQPEAALATFDKIVSHAPIIKGRRGEAGAVADAILKMLED